MTEKVTGVNQTPKKAEEVVIKISKENQGITQALFDYVKSQGMEMSDGAISKEEWGKTVDKLSEIQQQRAADKKPSLFSGGSEKDDYHSNFVVHKGDELKFSKSEIDEIYSSMGVSFSKSSPKTEQAAEAAPQGEAAKAQSKAKETGTKARETDAKTSEAAAKKDKAASGKKAAKKETLNDRLRKTDCDGVLYDPKTKTHYKKEDGRLEKMKARYSDSGKITQVRADGSHFEKGISDDGEKYTSLIDKNGKERECTFFDKTTGKKSQFCKYDSNENLVSSFFYDKNGKLDSSKSYDKNGHVVKELWYDKRTGKANIVNAWSYDKNGQRKSVTFINLEAKYKRTCNFYGNGNLKDGYEFKRDNGKTFRLRAIRHYNNKTALVEVIDQKTKNVTYAIFYEDGYFKYMCDKNGKKLK